MNKFTLELLGTNDTLLYSRYRPTILRYKDDLETKLETLTYYILLLLGWKVSCCLTVFVLTKKQKRQQCQDLILLEYKETGGKGFLKSLKGDLFLKMEIDKAAVEVYCI